MAQPKNFGFGDEEQMIRDSVARLLKERLGIERLRSLVAGDHREAYEADVAPLAHDEKLWRELVELGVTALAVPEAAGGAGIATVAVVAVAEEAGRAALPSPLISTLQATFILREAGPAAHAWLARIVGGEAATPAVTNSHGSWDANDTDVVARIDAGAQACAHAGTHAASRRSLNAAMPSFASSEWKSCCERGAAQSNASSRLICGTRATSCFEAASAFGPPRTSLPTSSSTYKRGGADAFQTRGPPPP